MRPLPPMIVLPPSPLAAAAPLTSSPQDVLRVLVPLLLIWLKSCLLLLVAFDATEAAAAEADVPSPSSSPASAVLSGPLSTLGDLTRDFNMNVEFQLKKLGITLEQVGNSTKCYGPLGCLHLTEDWYGLSRPVNVLPQEREVINTRFRLATRETTLPDRSEVLSLNDTSTVSESTFSAARDTKVIVHGFIDTGFVPWCAELSDELLRHGDYNVVTVDWGGGSAALYSQAAANTRLVALEVAALIQTIMVLQNGTYPASRFHLIGHSLGSHISGYVGETLQERNLGTLGRITGLDPAEPLFQSMPAFVRLDEGDAEFVDAIHTDAKSILMFGYGMEQPVGHVDFYPNGGTDQPGCSLLDLPISLDDMLVGDAVDKSVDSVKRHLVACSHTRAIHLYIDSLRRERAGDCAMIARECSTYEEFKMGLCFDCGEDGERCAVLGHRAVEYAAHARTLGKKNARFYLNTGSEDDKFCQHDYLVELQLARPKKAERWVQGFLEASLHGSKGEQTELDLTPNGSVRVTHGSRKAFLLSLDSDLGEVNIVGLKWKYDHEINPLDLTKVCVFLCSDHLFVRNVTIRSTQLSGGSHRGGTTPPPPREKYVVVCSGDSSSDFVDIPSQEAKLFYKTC